jgi:hypothetical protein
MSIEEDTKKAIEMGNKIAGSMDFIYDKYARPTFEEEYIGESPQDRQVGGSHYKDMAITPRDYILANNIEWDAGNVIKYVSRYKNKNGLQDLEKAKHYLEMLIELEDGKVQS